MSVLLREFLYYADGGNAVWTRLGKGEFFMGVVFSRLIYSWLENSYSTLLLY